MSAQSFPDHFSGHAAAYASARPRYPQDLYRFLAANCAVRQCAWDCATGNGQAAVALVEHFERVIATDASERQIAAADAVHGVDFRVAAAEASGLAAGSVDLVTVAQALHWFDIDAFFTEVRRVLKPAGVLAVWCYGVCNVQPEVDRLVQNLYTALDPWWPPQRALVEAGYSTITLPFARIECPVFAMQVRWRADDMLAYLDTWSATQRCRRDTGADPLQEMTAPLRAAWGQDERTVSWPLYLQASRRS